MKTAPLLLDRSQWRAAAAAMRNAASRFAARRGPDARTLADQAKRLTREFGRPEVQAQGLRLPYADLSALATALADHQRTMRSGSRRDNVDAAMQRVHQALGEHFRTAYVADDPEQRFRLAVESAMDSYGSSYQDDAADEPWAYDLDEGETIDLEDARLRAWYNMHDVHGGEGWQALLDGWIGYEGKARHPSGEKWYPRRSEWTDAIVESAMDAAV